MDFTTWFDDLIWDRHTYEIVDDDGVKNGDTVEIWEASYEADDLHQLPENRRKNVLIMHDYHAFATWQAMIWDGRTSPTLIEGRGPFNSLDDAKAAMRQWFKDACPIQRWTEHTAQRRTWGEKNYGADDH